MYPSPCADVLVAGAGLSGLATASLLHEAGLTVQVHDAAERAGGRIASLFDAPGGHYVADLGPTWVWTPYQPVAGRWMDRLGLRMFDQYEQGPGLYDQDPHAPAARARLPVQYGAQRVVGGSPAMIDRLVAALPRGTLRSSCPVTALAAVPDGVDVIVAGDRPETVRARHVVVAMPLRLAACTLDWQPGLPGPLLRALEATPTWMAPHAKAVVCYERPFWRDAGLSGRVVGRVGPLVEAHDHCGPDGSPAALFGFVGWPPDVRAREGVPALASAIAAQLTRCFGSQAPRPVAVHVHDWSTSRHVASQLDLVGPMEHPPVGPAILREPHRDGRVWFATSETAMRSPGLIEGAFDAAERTAAAILALQPRHAGV